MKKLIYFIGILVSLLSLSPRVTADEVSLAAKGAIALDANTGKILFEKDADKKLGIGSISNILTAYLVFDAIDKKELSLNKKITPSERLYLMSQEDYISGVVLTEKSYSVQDLLKASLHASSDAATLALAEEIAGSEEAFLKLMNQKLKEWKIDASFTSVTGLEGQMTTSQEDEEEASDKKKKKTDKANTENTLSAYELAIIANRLVNDHPQLFDLTSTPNNQFGEVSMSTTNLMLEGMPRMRGPVDGLKTGNSARDGQAFLATSNERGMRLITIVLGIDNPDQDPYLRFTEANRILTFIIQTYRPTLLVKEGKPVDKQVSTIIDGRQDQIQGVAKEDLVIVEKMGIQDITPVEVKTKKEGYQAPIAKGQEIGYLTFKDSDLVGHGYIEGKTPQIPLVAQKEVKKAFFPKVWWNHFVRYVNEKL